MSCDGRRRCYGRLHVRWPSYAVFNIPNTLVQPCSQKVLLTLSKFFVRMSIRLGGGLSEHVILANMVRITVYGMRQQSYCSQTNIPYVLSLFYTRLLRVCQHVLICRPRDTAACRTKPPPQSAGWVTCIRSNISCQLHQHLDGEVSLYMVQCRPVTIRGTSDIRLFYQFKLSTSAVVSYMINRYKFGYRNNQLILLTTRHLGL